MSPSCNTLDDDGYIVMCVLKEDIDNDDGFSRAAPFNHLLLPLIMRINDDDRFSGAAPFNHLLLPLIMVNI